MCVFVMVWQALLCMEPIYFIRWTTARQLISLVPARFEANSSIEDTISNTKCHSEQIESQKMNVFYGWNTQFLARKIKIIAKIFF